MSPPLLVPAAEEPPGPTVTVWDGTTERPATLVGVWDGTAIRPATLDVL